MPARPALVLSDVRAQPPKQDRGYATQRKDAEGDLPDMTAIIHTLMLHRELIVRSHMIRLIVDNRSPAEVPHWPAFAAWWASRHWKDQGRELCNYAAKKTSRVPASRC